MRECEKLATSVPHILPGVLVGALTLLAIIGIIISYLCIEAKRQKNFYGVEDKPDEDVVAAADNDVMKIVQSKEPAAEQIPGTPNASTVRVLVRRPCGSRPTGKLSAEVANLPDRPVSTVTTTKLEATIELDHTMRGPELLELLSECVGAEMRHCQNSLATECERVLAECIVTESRHILEKACGKCGGRSLLGDQSWMASGHENLMDHVGELKMELRFDVYQPCRMKVIAFRIEASAPPAAPSTAQTPSAAVMKSPQFGPGNLTTVATAKAAMTPVAPPARRPGTPRATTPTPVWTPGKTRTPATKKSAPNMRATTPRPRTRQSGEPIPPKPKGSSSASRLLECETQPTTEHRGPS
ncbi:hypothetical protein AAVH_12709 [Aphelenchoides avenae]|nr:hypothetical protein AAVH_12709 [Aphelenchus avenae]